MGTQLRSPGASRPKFYKDLPCSNQEGAGKTGCALHPRSRVQRAQKNTHTSIQVQREHPGLPCAMALRLTSCSPRWTALLPPSLLRSLLLKELDASTAASGPHDFAVRFTRLRPSHASRPPHLTARSWRSRSPLICR